MGRRGHLAVGVVATLAFLGAGAAGWAAASTPTPGRAEVIDPAECRVAPRSPENIAALLATPIALPGATPPAVAGRVGSEDDLPRGAPADAETVAAVAEVERHLAACLNAGDLPRLLALLTDDAARALLAFPIENVEGARTVADLVATPASPVREGERIALFPVRGVRVLPDGRVGAIVETGFVGALGTVARSVFHTYERRGGRWLVAGEIAIPTPPPPRDG